MSTEQTLRERVLALVLPFSGQQRGISTEEIAAELDVKASSLRMILGQLQSDGLVCGRRVSGVYRYVRGWKA